MWKMVTLIRFMIFRNVGSSTQVDYFYYYHHPLRKEMVTLRCTCTLFLMSRRPFQKSVWNMEKITVCVLQNVIYIGTQQVAIITNARVWFICSKIGKKCHFKSTKTHFLLFQKWQKINFCTRKKSENCIFGRFKLFSSAKIDLLPFLKMQIMCFCTFEIVLFFLILEHCVIEEAKRLDFKKY